jgi:hypothetical protein
LGTNLTSNEEMSTGVSGPPRALLKLSSVVHTKTLSAADCEMPQMKWSSPSRSGDKTRRDRLSPYRRPKWNVAGNIKEGSGEEDDAQAFKKEEQVMEDEVVDVPTLALISADPNTLMGPQYEAH